MAAVLQKFFYNATLPVLGLAGVLALSSCAHDPCVTQTVSTGTRGLLQNHTEPFNGNEAYRTDCVYRHDTPSSNWKLPSHLGHGPSPDANPIAPGSMILQGKPM